MIRSVYLKYRKIMKQNNGKMIISNNKNNLEDAGIEPATFRMQSGRSTN